MSEVLFYHLERRPLEAVLPSLLEKSLERGWRVVVQADSPERVSALDSLLWTYREESFLPHGTAQDGFAEKLPIFLTTGDENPNGAQVRFLVDGAEIGEVAGYQRIVFLFDGNDDSALASARAQWKTVKSAGHQVTYWQQNARGAWEKKA